MIRSDLRSAADAWFPETPPSCVSAVVARLPAVPDAPPRRRGRRGLVIALAALLLAGSALAARQLDLVPGVRIHRAETIPTVPYTMPPFGRQVSMQEARSAMPFEIVLPASLGEPDELLVDSDRGGAPVLTAVYGGAEGARVVFTQWRAESVLFEKHLGLDLTAESVDVGGSPGMWIGGAEHAVFYRGVGGPDERVGGYLTGGALVWERNGTTYRLEAPVARDRALELAASLQA